MILSSCQDLTICSGELNACDANRVSLPGLSPTWTRESESQANVHLICHRTTSGAKEKTKKERRKEGRKGGKEGGREGGRKERKRKEEKRKEKKGRERKEKMAEK